MFRITYVILGICLCGLWTSSNIKLSTCRSIASSNYNLIFPEEDGTIILSARKGIGIGPNIKLMPEWEAFGFFRAEDRIEWKISVPSKQRYIIYLDWAAEGSAVGNPFILTIGKKKLEGKNRDTGSWETFKEEPIGELKVKKGVNEVVFRAGEQIKKEGIMLDVRTIRLVPK